MKRLLTVLVLFGVIAPAQAHFIWLAPHKGAVQMVFSDSLDPDANVAITKIAQTKVFARSGAKSIDVKMEQAKDHYQIAWPVGIDALEIAGVCQYGVTGKKGVPFLLMYYAKTTIGPVKSDGKGWDKLPLEVVPAKPGTYRVLWQSKPAMDAELTALMPGDDEGRTLKRNDDGTFTLDPAVKPGTIGLRAKLIEKKGGELDGKKYEEVRHYSTWTFASGVKAKAAASANPTSLVQETKADAAATKLLADARAARATWTNFPGFTADLDVNVNGTVSKGKLSVASSGKVMLDLSADDGVKDWARSSIASMVGHRMPGTPLDTPCAFMDKIEQHPSGRAIRVLNDELHSSYRIRDRQIMEVNRVTGETRFTITVLENTLTKEKQYVPASYVVDTWEVKSGALVNSSAFHNTWTRIGAFDLPVTLRSVTAKAGTLDNRLITFSNLQLVK